MFTVQVPDLIIRQSIEVCRKTNFGQRGIHDGTPTQQLYGVIAQNAILFGLGHPLIKPSNDWDGGFDMVLSKQRIDIKTVIRTVPPKPEYECRVVADQMNYDLDAYLFTSYNTQTNQLTICGWLPKEEIKTRARVFRKGDVVERSDGSFFTCKLNSYQIYYHQLNHEAENFEQLIEEIDIYSILQ